MYKSIIIFVLAFVFLVNKEYNDKTLYISTHPFERLNGNVKQLTEINTDHLSGAMKHRRYITNFDRNGNSIETRIVGLNEVIVMKYTTLHDKSGKRIMSIINSNNVQNIFKYDSNDRISSATAKVGKNSKGITTTYKYDINGDLIEENNFILSGKTSLKTIFKYNSKHYLIEEDVLFQPQIRTVYKYISFDSRNNWTKRIKAIKEVKRSSNGFHEDTTTRQITYY